MLIRYSHTLTLTMLILLKNSKKYGHTCQQYAEALYLSYTGINADCHTGVFVDGINLMHLLPMLKPSQLALHSLTSPVASFLVNTVIFSLHYCLMSSASLLSIFLHPAPEDLPPIP